MNKSKRKGTEAETKLLAWLLGHGHDDAVRNPPAGVNDVGDLRCLTPLVLGGGPCVIEVKAWKDQTAAINAGLKELEVEMTNAGASHGVVVVKRVGKGDPGEWLAIRKVKDDPEIGER
jgi:Holliday junction resolvase